jgi:hypothetical protein
MSSFEQRRLPDPGGPREILLPDVAPEAKARLKEALAAPVERRRDAVADVAASFPRYLEAWAELGMLARDDVEAYAYFRVGYHRGLDCLRQAGWNESFRVPWRHEPNRGFLRSLEGLGRSAAAIGESDEQERCREFLARLDPSRYLRWTA